MSYRTDIDGLRALAVVSVILFHLGYLPHGYLGVDIFFVISGFLITSIVFNESRSGKFSVFKFYERRIRRIIPLLLVVSGIALILGLWFMLPDDLENLSQSVVASNISANNILMLITSADYWAVKNEYKPLMHTWSLGIEEQFYLLYPLIFLLLKGDKLKWIKPLLLLLSAISIGLFLISNNVSQKFYLIQFRFFELSIGGLAAIQFYDLHDSKKYYRFLLYLMVIGLIALLVLPLGGNDIKIILTTVLTAGVLVLGKFCFQKDRAYSKVLTNPVLVYLGQISFSLYMWHQLVLAFARYAFIDHITPINAIFLCALILMLSVLTYNLVEKPFRNREIIRTRYVLIGLSVLFVVSTSAAAYLYAIGGIYKDFPSLSIFKKDSDKRQLNFFSVTQNIHNNYNEEVRQLEKAFVETEKPKLLIIGNSFGRDVVNVVLASAISQDVQVRYFDIKKVPDEPLLGQRLKEADYVWIGVNGFLGKDWVKTLEERQHVSIDKAKLFIVGPKDFGYSNGIHYNRMSEIKDFTQYRSAMKKGMLQTNLRLKKEWGEQYIDLIGLIQDDTGNVLIFTPDAKFLSQDTNHLTRDGANYFADLLYPILQKFTFKAK